ncbi:hypothetical protein [Stenotrophomonas sp. KCTC 12332]|uniref:hypothetical protein n=1 Tax=Stenotrophomonas sp. KCTC 12332 TaxID=1793721 RepID=UPI0012E34ACA|nr:hypothetical protein [Stenotrophomonas sp. KCTC 12332]
MTMWKPAALPIGAFLAAAIWGAAAMVPFAPASEEMMFWIPVSIALTSAAAALVVAMMQDIILVAVKRWPLFVKFYPTLCLEPLPFAFLPIVLSLAGIAEFGPAMLSAALLLIGFSFAETLFAAALQEPGDADRGCDLDAVRCSGVCSLHVQERHPSERQ